MVAPGGYEVIIADNGSTDDSHLIAAQQGATVIHVHQRGYGAALTGGISAAKGKYVVMGDADGTYDFRQSPIFIAKLQQGYDLIMGNRFIGGISPGAMPLLHKYLGNPVLTAIGKQFFGITVGDFHCGIRAFSREAILDLDLQCLGMEYASEMVIKSSLRGLSISEVPVRLAPGPPGRIPHLKTWRDGWRHLKFMLSFAPKYSFLPAGAFLFIIASILAFSYGLRVPFFAGANTLVFAATCFMASINIFSDYLMTREMLYSQYTIKSNQDRRLVDKILGAS